MNKPVAIRGFRRPSHYAFISLTLWRCLLFLGSLAAVGSVASASPGQALNPSTLDGRAIKRLKGGEVIRGLGVFSGTKVLKDNKDHPVEVAIMKLRVNSYGEINYVPLSAFGSRLAPAISLGDALVKRWERGERIGKKDPMLKEYYQTLAPHLVATVRYDILRDGAYPLHNLITGDTRPYVYVELLENFAEGKINGAGRDIGRLFLKDAQREFDGRVRAMSLGVGRDTPHAPLSLYLRAGMLPAGYSMELLTSIRKKNHGQFPNFPVHVYMPPNAPIMVSIREEIARESLAAKTPPPAKSPGLLRTVSRWMGLAPKP